MMEDVGDAEIIVEGGDDQADGGEQHRNEYGETGAARGFGDAIGGLAQPGKQERPERIGAVIEGFDAALGTPVRGGVAKHQRDDSGGERIDAQRQGNEQGKTTYLRHVGGPQHIFSESHR